MNRFKGGTQSLRGSLPNRGRKSPGTSKLCATTMKAEDVNSRKRKFFVLPTRGHCSSVDQKWPLTKTTQRSLIMIYFQPVEQIELSRGNYIAKLAYSEANWNGDTANLRVVAFGQTATAQVYVLDDALRIEVQLPWILAALTGKIQGILKSNAEESLRIGHSPPKA
jgi:Putative polyhydroxyalkanoic acid system protein (PHA_gran_rgn)